MTDKRPDFTSDHIKDLWRKPVLVVSDLPDGGAGFEGCARAIDAGATPSDDSILRIGEAVAELEEHIRDLKAFAGKPIGGRAEEHDDRGPEPREFTESAEGDCARERWARHHDELNGAPENDGDR